MLMNSEQFKGLSIRTSNGEIGVVEDLYFDAETWGIRYFVVDSGGWLGGRSVLISPYSVTGVDWQAKCIDVVLSKEQVENSPNINTHLPVSRQHEVEYLGYYGYPDYWGGPNMWGPAFNPAGMAAAVSPSTEALAERIRSESADSHLHSLSYVNGYTLETADGELGHVAAFIIDDESWAIRYIEVATQNWWPGKKVLVSPSWAEGVSWVDSKVFVALSREAIQNAPEYHESAPITRDYEDRLFLHYGKPPYWLSDGARESAFAMRGV